MNMPASASPGERVAFGEERRSRSWRWLLIALVIAAIAAGAWFAFKPEPAPAAKPTPAAARVTVMVPGVTTVDDLVRVTGSIAARREMPVGVQGEGGMVTAVLVKEGDAVRRGQTLVRIDRAVQAQQVEQMRAGIGQAVADAALARAELERAQNLVSRGFISKADVERRIATRDGANARVSLARAQLGEMQARVARLDVRAPDNGLVLARAVEPGQVVGAGSPPLFRIAQDGAMEMRAAVAEQDLAKMRLGQRVGVRLVGGADEFTGRIWLIEPIIDPAQRQGIVRVALGPDRRLRPGAFASASIASGAIVQPILPQSAVQSTEEGSFVLVIGPDNKVVRRPVEVGLVTAAGLSIRSGLSGRERVVATSGAFLNPGETVIPVLRRAG